MKITNRYLVKYEVIVKTGLHIGGNKETYGIGGIDSPVIKNPMTNEPIIPGSSIKGKMRMLVKHILCEGKENIESKKAFGPEPESKRDKNNRENAINEKNGITRIIFRDLFLTENSKIELEKKLGKNFYTEIKAENIIDPIKISAMPRFIERVPVGATFSGECIVQKLDGDTEDFVEFLKKGFELINNSALGGSSSRGYGKVEINVTEVKEL